jgi:hypothetical protein
MKTGPEGPVVINFQIVELPTAREEKKHHYYGGEGLTRSAGPLISPSSVIAMARRILGASTVKGERMITALTCDLLGSCPRNSVCADFAISDKNSLGTGSLPTSVSFCFRTNSTLWKGLSAGVETYTTAQSLGSTAGKEGKNKSPE